MNTKMLGRRSSVVRHASVLVSIYFLVLLLIKCVNAGGISPDNSGNNSPCKNPENCAYSSSYSYRNKHENKRASSSPVYRKPSSSHSVSRSQTDNFNRAVRQAFHTLPQELLQTPVNTSSYIKDNYKANLYQYPEAVHSLPQQNNYYRSADEIANTQSKSNNVNVHGAPGHHSYKTNIVQQQSQPEGAQYESYYYPPESDLSNPNSSSSNLNHRYGIPATAEESYGTYYYPNNEQDTKFSYDSTLNDLYPNGTSQAAETQVYKEYLDSQSEGSAAGHYEETHSSGLYNYYQGYGKYPKDVDIDAHELDVELSERKVTIFLVALWYM